MRLVLLYVRRQNILDIWQFKTGECLGSSGWLILCGDFAVLQAPIFDSLSFDPFTLFDDGLCPAEVGVGGRYVVQALVVALIVVMFDERLDLGFEIAG